MESSLDCDVNPHFRLWNRLCPNLDLLGAIRCVDNAKYRGIGGAPSCSVDHSEYEVRRRAESGGRIRHGPVKIYVQGNEIREIVGGYRS